MSASIDEFIKDCTAIAPRRSVGERAIGPVRRWSSEYSPELLGRALDDRHDSCAHHACPYSTVRGIASESSSGAGYLQCLL